MRQDGKVEVYTVSLKYVSQLLSNRSNVAESPSFSYRNQMSAMLLAQKMLFNDAVSHWVQ